MLFETDAGVLVDVEAFVNARYGYDIRCEVVGETGTVSLASPPTVRVRSAGQDAVDVPSRFQERFAAAYVQQLQLWASAAADGRAAGPSAWDGYAATAVCEAAYQSLTSSQPTAVRLEARPDLYDDANHLVGHDQ